MFLRRAVRWPAPALFAGALAVARMLAGWAFNVLPRNRYRTREPAIAITTTNRGSEPLDWLRREVWPLPVRDQRSDDEILGYNAHSHFD